MSDPQDIWARWLLRTRYGGDERRLKEIIEFLVPIRDELLNHVYLSRGKTLLDIGCGDGLIGFGALEKFPESRVIFSDISQDLLHHVQQIAVEMQVLDRTGFLHAPAEDLSEVPTESIDAVTHRSVLIYVQDKKTAFEEFHRVLKPDGCLSFFEPINRFGCSEPPHMLWGYDVSPVAEAAQKVRALFLSAQPLDSDPMVNFDEHDLIEMVENVGFRRIEFQLRGNIRQRTLRDEPDVNTWDRSKKISGNPKIPTLEEAIAQTLSGAEREKFIDHIRQEAAYYEPATRQALLYLWAVK